MRVEAVVWGTGLWDTDRCERRVVTSPETCRRICAVEIMIPTYIRKRSNVYQNNLQVIAGGR